MCEKYIKDHDCQIQVAKTIAAWIPELTLGEIGALKELLTTRQWKLQEEEKAKLKVGA